MAEVEPTIRTWIGTKSHYEGNLHDDEGNLLTDRPVVTHEDGLVSTTVQLASLPLQVRLEHIAGVGRTWDVISPDEIPDWVASEDPVMAAELAKQWKCAVREPLESGQ